MKQAKTTTSAAGDARISQTSISAQIARLRWLAHLRWFEIAAIAVLSILQNYTHGLAFLDKLVLVAFLCLFNLVLIRSLKRGRADRADRLIFIPAVVLGLDIVVWLGLMLTTSPYLVAVPVFLLAVAASLLPWRVAYVLAGFSCLVFLLFRALNYLRDMPQAHDVPVIVLGSLAVMGCFVAIVYFTNAILSRLRRINTRLLEANRQLSGLDLAKSRFLRMSSHQLRGPLAAIHALVSAVQEVGGLSHKQYDLMLKIHHRLDEMMVQLDEMMRLSSLHESRYETKRRQAVEATRVLNETVKGFQEEARQKGLKLTLQTEALGPIQAWDDALETIIENLLSNAVKYTPSGGSISVRASKAGPSVEIEVADTGIGIPPQQQGQVFREFFRATNAQQISGGTGLGLSITKAIVDRLGGQIRFVSAVGIGTTVTVILPSASLAAGPTEVVASDPPQAAKELPTTK